MTSPVQLSGLAGFDSSSVVSQLVAVAQQPVDAMQTQINNIDSAQIVYGNFKSQLSSLQTAVQALSTTSGFVSMAATSTDSSVVGSVTGTAAAGSYTLSVSQLATTEKLRSDPQTDSTTPLGQAGTLTFQVGSGSAVNIDIAATDTLTDVASKIARSGARVSAGIINAGGSYRLQLQGLDTGASNNITITEGGTINLGLSNPANVVQSAQDAKLKVDGLDITRSTNSVADAIPGVTLALTKTIPDASAATVTVAGDPSKVESKIQSIVSAYNTLVSTVHMNTGYGTTKATNSVLQADPTMRRALDQLSTMISGIVPGGTGAYTSMATVGLKHNTDGTLTFDSSTFETALAANPDAVSRLFVTDTSNGSTGLMSSLSTLIDGYTNTTNGMLKARTDALTSTEKSLQKSHDDKQDQVNTYQDQLKAQYAALDAAMAKYQQMTSQLSSLSSSG